MTNYWLKNDCHAKVDCLNYSNDRNVLDMCILRYQSTYYFAFIFVPLITAFIGGSMSQLTNE